MSSAVPHGGGWLLLFGLCCHKGQCAWSDPAHMLVQRVVLQSYAGLMGAVSGVSSNGSTAVLGAPRAQTDLDFDKWYECGLPMPLLAACTVCRAGVKRAHLVDARIDGGLLLELYSRDGVGTMISTDFYEGIRTAGPQVWHLASTKPR